MAGGGVQRILKFLKYWDYNSFNISILTVKGSYFYAEDKSLAKEIPSEVSIYRTGSLDPFRIAQLIQKYLPGRNRKAQNITQESGGFLRKLSSLVFIPDSRILWLPFAVYKIRRINRQTPVDLIIATLPPFTVGIIAKIAHKFFAIPYLLDFRDAWTNNPYLPEVSSIHTHLQKRLEKWGLKTARGLTFVNPNLHSYYLSVYPFLNCIQTQMIRNGFDPDDFRVVKSKKLPASSTMLKIGVMGTIYSQGNAPNTLIEAISEVLKDNPQLANRLKIFFVGKWTKAFRTWTNTFNLDRQINWVGYLEHREALKFVSGMNLLTLALHSDIPGSGNVTPGRIYEYLYLKRPIIALCPLESDLAGLVQATKSGLVFDYHDKEGLKSTILNWFENEAGITSQFRFENLEEFNRNKLTTKMVKFVIEITETG
jgi:hypothetical protein